MATTGDISSGPFVPLLHRDKIMAELKEKGYCVIPDVLTSHECDAHTATYRDWLAKFPEGDWPLHEESLILRYRIGHFKPTWEVRLAVKKVFETIWQTKKLLASFDSVAISPPPESYPTLASFATPGYTWLHIDQASPRQGLHCYQGAVYLEDTSHTDYCFRVLQGSHQHIEKFYATFPEAGVRSIWQKDFCPLDDRHAKWYGEHGCPLTKVPVPKGGWWCGTLVLFMTTADQYVAVTTRTVGVTSCSSVWRLLAGPPRLTLTRNATPTTISE